MKSCTSYYRKFMFSENTQPPVKSPTAYERPVCICQPYTPGISRAPFTFPRGIHTL